MKGGYRGLQEVTEGYKGLQEFTRGNRGLKSFTSVTGSYKVLPGVRVS